MSYLPQHAVVWTEIPVSDLDRAMAFYAKTTGIGLKKITDMGPNPIAMFVTEDEKSGVAGHLYPGKPAGDGSGPTIHFAAAGSLEEAVERVTQAGATEISPVITIPPGRFFYCNDPDGNSIAFFEAAA
ncbi:VOC family protein [Tropicimonas sp. TH_r6]|uniref:VOC family protein n=1 Tax=Tropicimonas sp. TH_r6 TaxID=3082085 RepID=UPI00295443A1|nr:VOC family protein [Tropicimonas sp. TH_r6]MDV7141927.1 VOC family protein [Tropicimonas sp. TH_r6]